MTSASPSSTIGWSGHSSMTIKLSQGDVVTPRVYSNIAFNISNISNDYNEFSGYKID